MNDTDIVVIGDINRDVFIKIHQGDVNCLVDSKDNKLCFNFGDKIPYDSMNDLLGGNSANVAVGSARLGLTTCLLSHLGDDTAGKNSLEEFEKNNVDTKLVNIEHDKKTNIHFVLWYDVDRTILTKHESFVYNLPDIGKPKWIYLTSIAESSLSFYNQIGNFLEKNPETKLAFQPGTFQIKCGADMLSSIYKQTEIFFCNVEEAQEILKSTSRDLKTLLQGIATLGPKNVCITDGISGAYTFDGTSMWFVPVYPGKPFERTGAGDAFAGTVVSALALGKSLEEALLWGPINSMSVVLYVGAQAGLLTQEKIKEYLSKAPADYKLKKLE